MGKRKPLAKWVLPLTVNPTTSTCWLVPVPDDPYHRAAFLGALHALGSAYKWQDDLDHTAKEVAEVWRRIADNLTECPPMISFRNPDPCTVQVSFDSGDTWTTIYSDGDCNSANPAQPGAAGDPALGTCVSYFVELPAASQWFLPFSIGDGDTVTVTGAKGIWTDSGAALYCPDGSTYSAGACTGSGGTAIGDPCTSANHMSLILAWGSGVSPNALPLMAGVATIPGGTGPIDAWIQANDAILGDDFGQVSFTVQICKAGFTHTFDFAIDQQGWALVVANCYGQYDAACCWRAAENCSSGDPDCFIGISFAARTIISFDITLNQANGGGANHSLHVYRYLSGTETIFINTAPPDGNNQHFTATPGASADRIIVDYNTGQNSGSSGTIGKIVIQGLGTDPF